MFEVEIVVPLIGVRASFCRVQVVRSLDCKSSLAPILQGKYMGTYRIARDSFEECAVVRFVFTMPIECGPNLHSVMRTSIWKAKATNFQETSSMGLYYITTCVGPGSTRNYDSRMSDREGHKGQER